MYLLHIFSITVNDRLSPRRLICQKRVLGVEAYSRVGTYLFKSIQEWGLFKGISQQIKIIYIFIY